MIVTVDFVLLYQARPDGDANRAVHASFLNWYRCNCRHTGFQIL